MRRSNYYHLLYKKENFLTLASDAVEGIKSWRFTKGGSDARAIARGGSGDGGLGYSFRSQPHFCFCAGAPCKHVEFTGTPTDHRVYACVQEQTDRAQATSFFDTIAKDTPLASKGAVDDSTSGDEVLWLSIAKGELEVATEKFTAAGGAGAGGTRTIAKNWAYVDIDWLVKIKTDSEGHVHYEAWKQPQHERTVLTKAKILTVPIVWQRVEERRNAPARYVMSAATYQRLVDAVK